MTIEAYSDVEYVFEPHTYSIPNVREYIVALWDRRHFMTELARTDLRTARSSTALGSLWNVLDPLFQAAIYFFLYSVLRRGNANSSFLPVLLGGFYLFTLSMGSLNEGGNSIKRAKGLMLNSTFPRAMLPIASVYKAYRKFVPSACVFLLLFPLFGGKYGAGFLVLPLLLAIQAAMNIGFSLMMSTFIVLFPDFSSVMNYITRVMFFATPVVYPVALLGATPKLIIGWQPLFPLFASFQAVFSGGTPNPLYVLEAAAWAVGLVFLGGRAFLRHEREFALHL